MHAFPPFCTPYYCRCRHCYATRRHFAADICRCRRSLFAWRHARFRHAARSIISPPADAYACLPYLRCRYEMPLPAIRPLPIIACCRRCCRHDTRYADAMHAMMFRCRCHAADAAHDATLFAIAGSRRFDAITLLLRCRFIMPIALIIDIRCCRRYVADADDAASFAPLRRFAIHDDTPFRLHALSACLRQILPFAIRRLLLLRHTP